MITSKGLHVEAQFFDVVRTFFTWEIEDEQEDLEECQNRKILEELVPLVDVIQTLFTEIAHLIVRSSV